MCRVCEMKKEQERPVQEIGRLIAKREKAILMGDNTTADEIKPVLMDMFGLMLKEQEKLPNLMDVGNADVEVIACLLLGGRKKDAARRL